MTFVRITEAEFRAFQRKQNAFLAEQVVNPRVDTDGGIRHNFYVILTLIFSFLFLCFSFIAIANSNFGLRHASNPLISIGSWMGSLIGLERDVAFVKMSGPLSQTQLWQVVQNASKQHQVSPELIWAIIEVESRFNHRAKSHAGAQGLMQLMPETARELSVRDPFNPFENVHAGTRYISELLERFDGQKEMALAAYNAGPGAVNRFGGIPPYRETKRYVSKVMERYRSNKALNGG